MGATTRQAPCLVDGRCLRVGVPGLDQPGGGDLSEVALFGELRWGQGENEVPRCLEDGLVEGLGEAQGGGEGTGS